jgi:hypothetical protein
VSDIEERLREHISDDHVRGCEGRQYSCDCGYDLKTEGFLELAAAEIDRLAAENEKLLEALRPFANYHVTGISSGREGWSIFIPCSSPQPKFADFDDARAALNSHKHGGE